jgi:threonylcarbamoyladenosine tRNA methylthiotransferase MtaB
MIASGMRVFFSNLGCKLNQAELDRLARGFASSGHSVVGSLAEADVHVINSCTVTHVAARDSRKTARRGKRVNPEIKTVLTGCYVNASPGEAADLAGVDMVIPNERKDDLVAEVERAFAERHTVPGAQGPLDIPYVPLELTNTRSLVKIEDGCSMPCTFCIIPSVRGPQRSRPLDDVVNEVRELTATGYQEVVVTGVQISSYRWQGKGLFELVSTLLSDTEVPRIRLTSIAPWQFDLRLLDLFDSGRLCRHFHLSLQSGSEDTLKRMRRPYTPSAFASLVESIRSELPAAGITTDVIVGFPGETEREFDQSLDFTSRMSFSKVHAFPYSSRPGTAAASMPGHLPHPVKRERMARMLSAAERAERAFWEKQLGSDVEILWERQKSGYWLGMTDNYIRVLTRQPQQSNWLGRATLARTLEGGVEVSFETAPPGPGHPSDQIRQPTSSA